MQGRMDLNEWYRMNGLVNGPMNQIGGGASGGDVTTLPEGASLTANIALVKNNAAVGAQIAVALADLDRTSATR